MANIGNEVEVATENAVEDLENPEGQEDKDEDEDEEQAQDEDDEWLEQQEETAVQVLFLD